MSNRHKPSRFKSLAKRWQFKYKLLILNENTLEEVFHFRMSRLTVFLYGGIVIIIGFTLIYLLILFTPLKHFLPGASDASIRDRLLSNTVRIDSLVSQVKLQELQDDAIKDIIAGNIAVDSILPVDSVKLETWAKISLDKSEREKAFCEQFEQEEKYNLGVITNPQSNKSDAEVFFMPTKGSVITHFSRENNRYGIVIATSPGQPVLSVLKGAVVMASYTLNDEYVIAVQHDNGYMSIYKNASRLLKNVGDHVSAGEGIAIVGGSDSDSDGSHLHFELWQQGQAVNPEKLIIF